MEQLLTPKEVAKLLRVNYRKVLDLIALGDLRAYKVGGVFRICEEEITRYLRSVEVEPFPRKSWH